MMGKKLMLRLCLILLAAFSAFSCRTDQLHENEDYRDVPVFGPVSRRISLNESKLRKILSPLLEKAEKGIGSFSNANVNGKTVNYGNGISIDTDEVIYIENGPDYHTYTFHIKRENAPENAPLENLLLVPLPDGSYREFLITYHFTSSEKDRLRKGLP